MRHALAHARTHPRAQCTFAGKLIGTCTVISGVLVLALPVSIVGTHFSREFDLVAAKKLRERKVSEGLSSVGYLAARRCPVGRKGV